MTPLQRRLWEVREAGKTYERGLIVANLRARATEEKRYGSAVAADALLDAANYIERGDHLDD